MLIVTGINRDGYREILELGGHEDVGGGFLAGGGIGDIHDQSGVIDENLGTG